MFTQITIRHQCEFYEIKMFNGHKCKHNQYLMLNNSTMTYTMNPQKKNLKWKLQFQTQAMFRGILISLDDYVNALQFLEDSDLKEASYSK